MGPAEFLEREWTLRFPIQGLQEELGCRLWIPSPTFEDPEDQVGFGPSAFLPRRRIQGGRLGELPGGAGPTPRLQHRQGLQGAKLDAIRFAFHGLCETPKGAVRIAGVEKSLGGSQRIASLSGRRRGSRCGPKALAHA